ncbi:p21-activated protein kinase-interacting protein 1-like [Planococcus citri]|uniref:p21-activated protein kinase-interacting protein 1-like n=1 Tax=Planococcus citri TaxID=170843 RepID=UPI0031F9B3F6
MESASLLNCTFEVIVGTYEDFVLGYVFSNESKELVQSFATRSHQGSVRCVSCTSTLAASGGSDEVIQLYNMVTRKEAGTIMQHEGTISHLQFTPEQSHLISCSEDGSIALYRVGSWQLEKVWASAHKGSGVTSIGIHPSSKMALSLGQNKTLRTWNLIKGRPAYTVNLSNLGKQMDSVIWSTRGSYFAVSSDNKIYVFDVTLAGIKMTIECTSRITCMSFLNDTVICFGENGGFMICHSVQEESELWRIKVADSRVKCLSCVSEKWIVTGNSDGQIIVWEVSETESQPVQVAASNIGTRLICMSIRTPVKIENN